MKIIKIGSLGCPSCIIMNNIFNKISNEINLDIINYDYDFDEDEIIKYNVGNILPEIIILDDDNNEIERIIGEKKEQEIVDIIKKYK